MGHFFACRRHGIAATLPYFIPAPTLIGTFGALIKIRSPFSSKKALYDVGLAGPLAGFLVALPVIAMGISRSRIIEKVGMSGGMTLGEPLVFTLLGRLLLGEIPAQRDLLVHPMAFAGWFGLLATAFNLFPIGQLDGGHILYALLGKKAYYAGVASIVVLVFLGIFFWQGWLLWALIATLVGLHHPPIFEDERLDPKRKVLAFAALFIFILSFTPVPLSIAP
jgi:membrane-associated protease RseP (regulator of RpoE activity)